jgi:hypothetical protein
VYAELQLIYETKRQAFLNGVRLHVQEFKGFGGAAVVGCFGNPKQHFCVGLQDAHRKNKTPQLV